MIVYDPMRVLEVEIMEAKLEDCPDLIGDLERLKAQALLKLTTPTQEAPVARQNQWYTIPEIAEILKISAYRGYELARQGKLPHHKFGKSVRVSSEQLAAFQRSRKI
ncbi:MAG: helix-turn-helix domain-containing protein [Nitrospira sp.]|nr:helix-turn-helix domain-containing protein [Nitrospira sp.]